MLFLFYQYTIIGKTNTKYDKHHSSLFFLEMYSHLKKTSIEIC